MLESCKRQLAALTLFYQVKNTASNIQALLRLASVIFTILFTQCWNLLIPGYHLRKFCIEIIKIFNGEAFLSDLSTEISRESLNGNNTNFEKTVSKVLDKHVPLKEKVIRGNEKPHMNKTLKKAIMKRSRLRNVFLNFLQIWLLIKNNET